MHLLRRTRLAPLTALLLLLTALTTLPAHATATPLSSTILENTITATTIDPRTSLATVHGTVQCSAPTQLTVYAWARQLRGLSDQFAQYFGGTQVTCATTPTAYSVTVTPGYLSDRLVPGPASVGTWAEGCGSGGCFGLGTDGDRRLVPTP